MENGTRSLPATAVANEATKAELVVRRVAKQLSNKAADRKVSIIVNSQASDVSVAISTRDLTEIVRRLVDNAIKFSKPQGGQVTLTTRRVNDRWILDVADEGIGIRLEAREGLFEPFRQVDRDKMEQQGPGLGLAIIRRLVEQHGGQVGLESEPGKGSTFTVQLPIAAAWL